MSLFERGSLRRRQGSFGWRRRCWRSTDRLEEVEARGVTELCANKGNVELLQQEVLR